MSSTPIQLVGILLVNESGAVLLQLRSRQARAEPNKWSLPGGHVEPGESPAAAARRELKEETGLRVVDLQPFARFTRPSAVDPAALAEWHLFAGRTSARDEDIAFGEGQAAAFVPIDALAGLNLSPTAVDMLTRFVSSRPWKIAASGTDVKPG